MAEITNLNQYRKQRKKDEKRKSGAVNKASKGRTKFERLAAKLGAEKSELQQDGKKFIERARPKDRDED
ncbi:MAG: DUF4169 family protein [Rhodospirillaceae bacterium]|jgi:hypothetical protein|nr:DUF4169 family protein [Rhodospirillaceae bacterium]MBT3628041.1 DUF4169 family protein [Rhodospirillaceae bacterium]MBT3927579.1 DUF4169 family protein [Rhodospirillaceae bacterium]MBT4426587.1 DUF4169 family protein [Rhodospirillaceae bacterium]MBT5038082.1 DUF4169 family protein [Rhodospirillaceae bacterium]